MSLHPFCGIFHGRDPKKHTNATVLEMGDWTASSGDSDHEKENVEPVEKKRKSLKLNRNRIDRWDFIGEEHENDLSKKCILKNTAAAMDVEAWREQALCW